MVSVALAALVVLFSHAAHARPARPFDAPVTETLRATLPEVTPEFARVDEAGISIVFHPGARDRARGLLARSLATRTELSSQFGRNVLSKVEIRIAAATSQMSALSPVDLPPSVTAVAIRDAHLVILSLAVPVTGEPVDIEERLRHGLSHLALDEAVFDHDVPRWFHEGYAAHVSGGDRPQRGEALTLATLHGRLLYLRDVDDAFPDRPGFTSLAVAEAADFVRFLIDRYGKVRFAVLIQRLGAGEGFDVALARSYGGDLGRVEDAFRRDVARRYSFVPVFAGAMLVLLTVVIGISLRRRRVAHALPERPLPAPRRLRARVLEAPVVADACTLRPPMPADPEVPRVEHAGRWYTLH